MSLSTSAFCVAREETGDQDQVVEIPGLRIQETGDIRIAQADRQRCRHRRALHSKTSPGYQFMLRSFQGLLPFAYPGKRKPRAAAMTIAADPAGARKAAAGCPVASQIAPPTTGTRQVSV